MGCLLKNFNNSFVNNNQENSKTNWLVGYETKTVWRVHTHLKLEVVTVRGL